MDGGLGDVVKLFLFNGVKWGLERGFCGTGGVIVDAVLGAPRPPPHLPPAPRPPHHATPEGDVGINWIRKPGRVSRGMVAALHRRQAGCWVSGVCRAVVCRAPNQ